MGTRAVITFRDNNTAYSVYKHWDGDPSNMVRLVREAMYYAWRLPRFEASEFACAFIVAAKIDKYDYDAAGDVYLSKGADFHGDLDYTYHVYMIGKELYMQCLLADNNKEVFYSPLIDIEEKMLS